MKHRTPRLLYFSLIPSRISVFWGWVDVNGYKYGKNTIFRQAEVPYSFTHAADLLMFLNQYDQNLQSLHVVIDYESIKKVDDIDIIKNAIVEYPEVQFLFDNHYANGVNVSSFLFPDIEFNNDIRFINKNKKEELKKQWKSIEEKVDYSLVELHLMDPDAIIDPSVTFARIISGYDNTFDASNLRYAIKFRKYLKLKVHHSRNFKKIQDSRFKNFAICIEEESKQNIFNSYSLYTNGYRVLPITTLQELEIVNSATFKLPHECPYECKWENDSCEEHCIIIRDFDLQFEDENQSSIDKIRGYRYCTANDLGKGAAFYVQYKKFIGANNKRRSFYIGWNDLTHIHNRNFVKNDYWNRLTGMGYPIYFITKGPKYSKLIHSSNGEKTRISEDNKTLYLSGFAKPVCGLYSPFQLLPEVKTTYGRARYYIADSDYEIRTSREDHDHSTPLNIYDMANRMVRRAEIYYNNNRYLLAALIAGEALELLNGFHHRLMIKAYYIQAIAENAISMDAVGSNEKYLAKDTQFRVDKIIEDINRFYYGYKEKSKWNVLNHIFSTCRQFCKEHEHFESEAVFISALGHLNEGYELPEIINELKEIKRKGKNELVSFWNIIMKWREEKNIKNDGKQRK